MTRFNYVLPLIVAFLMCLPQACTQEAMKESPITPGYWSWPREKNLNSQAIAERCHTQFSVQLANGPYFTVKLRDDANEVISPPQVSEVGFCKFNRETKVEACNLVLNHSEGTTYAGLIESRFSFDADGTLKMTVTPTVNGTQEKPFDIYPVHCPEDGAWQDLGLGGVAALPLGPRTQTVAVIGFLHSGSAGVLRGAVAEFREGLKEAGYVEGQNVAIEFRWANLQFGQLPMLANDLVHRQAAVIVAAGGPSAVEAVKSATSTIPIVSANSFDLVEYGYAASLNRPGGNITGLTALSDQLMGKQVGILHELLPRATTLAFLSSGSSA
jgi:ABC transporter substrate binding protein